MTDYDTWRLSGPDECDDPEMVECDQCEGTGSNDGGGKPCRICNGSGEVAVEIDEPDDDYLYERARDDAMDDRP